MRVALRRRYFVYALPYKVQLWTSPTGDMGDMVLKYTSAGDQIYIACYSTIIPCSSFFSLRCLATHSSFSSMFYSASSNLLSGERETRNKSRSNEKR